MMIENGQELGISIRGGAEHGLGIYVSAVEERSVAEAYGVNVSKLAKLGRISYLYYYIRRGKLNSQFIISARMIKISFSENLSDFKFVHTAIIVQCI